MTRDNKQKSNFDALRKRAEEFIANKGGPAADADGTDFIRLIQELEVYQVELEMMNEQLRHTARQLETARDEYQGLYDTAPVGFVTVDRNGIIERCNATAARMLDTPAHRLVGRAFSARILQEDRDIYFSSVRDFASGKRISASCELRLITGSGLPLYAHLQAEVKKDHDGRVSHWRFALSDITELKRAEDLKISEKRFREAFEHAPVGIALTDAEGFFLHVNDALCTMLDYTREELIGAHATFSKLTHPEDIEVTRNAYARLMSGKIPAFSLEKRYIRKDGAIIWVRASVTLKKNEAGQPDQIVAMIEDITRRMEAEEHLRQAQKMEAIGRLAGGVAHEFNNMLNVIHGNAELLGLRLEKDSPLRNYVREITSAARRSADMAGHLLSYSRKSSRMPQVIDVNQVIEDQKWMLQRLIGEAVDFQFLPGDVPWPIRIDPSQFDQILTNLAVNARDAIPGTGQVTITTRNQRFDAFSAPADLKPGDYVRISFSDTGVGMDAHTRERVFEPYFTTKDVGKGTGLGLAAVYGIVKQNNGDIEVESEPEKGTTFHIYLPAIRAEADGAEIENDKIISGKGETVLIAEDEPQVLELAQTILKHAGYRVLAAATPGEAIALARQNKNEIDLLITDVIMPEMNGGVLKSKIESICPNIRSLFMSGYTDEVIAGKDIPTQNTHLINKPFTVGSLTRKVRDVLER